MNLMKYIPNAVTSRAGRTILLTQKNSPTILFAVGVVGVVGTVVLACKATLKVEEVLDEAEKDLVLADSINQNSSKEVMQEKTLVYVKTTVKLTRLYAPAVIVGTLSIAALTGSHRILTSRNAGLTAAYAAVDKAFTEYRKRVVDDVGEDKDREYRYGAVKREIVTETDKGPKVSEIASYDPNALSMYSKEFRKGNRNWQPTPSYNLAFLKGQQSYANDRLWANGFVLLNDVYEALGFERTKPGMIVGWLRDGEDRHIDFGIWDKMDPDQFDTFMVGRDGSINLDFNVDGNIFDKL
jgi:hypothetical protein